MRKNVAGISPVDIHGIENIDLSHVVLQVRRQTTMYLDIRELTIILFLSAYDVSTRTIARR